MARYSSQSELSYLRDRVTELEQQNGVLKESLQELMAVNKELTQSIEEYNHQNVDNSIQQEKIIEMQNTIEAMNQQIMVLRSQGGPHPDQPSNLSEGETQSLVNVLEELIESFKNMQTRYEGEILEYQTGLETFRGQSGESIKRLEEQYQQKLNTLEPVIARMQRQQQSFHAIEEKTKGLELTVKGQPGVPSSMKAGSGIDQAEMEALREQLSQKDQVIEFHRGVLAKLKQKFSEKM